MIKFLTKAIVFALGTSFILSGCSPKETKTNTTELKSVVFAQDELNGVFNPFFYKLGYDKEVTQRVIENFIGNDRNGQPVDGVCYYEAPVETTDANGNAITVYTFKLKDEITFSDGTKPTADDMIFTYHVFLDPTYDGMGTIYTTPILGVNEYRYDDPNYSVKLEEIETQAQNVTDAEITAFIEEYCTNDYEEYGEDAIIEAIEFKNDNNLSGDALKKAVIQAYIEYEIEHTGIEGHRGNTILAKKNSLIKEYISSNLSDGVTVTDIEGIKKIDEKTVQVTITGVDPKAIWNLGDLPLVSAAYYGKSLDGKAEYTKGDLTVVKEKTSKPVGSGAFLFGSFENNVISFTPNPLYYKGAPTYNLKYQVLTNANKLESVILGDVDIMGSNATPDDVQRAKDEGLDVILVDNLGFGYIGLNADTIPDINVRKGLMYLMDRKPGIEAYYGELATVIERPESKVSWAYPKSATEFYGFNSEKALESFKLAGYVQTQEGGKNVLKKDGVQLKIEFIFPGGDTQDHPVAGIAQKMKTEFENLGGILDLRSLSGSVYWDSVYSNNQQIWAAAWSSDLDPDMYQIYHSEGATNYYNIKNARLDKLIMDARQTTDIEKRKVFYAEALDIIMDEAVIMPVYQRKNMYVINSKVVDVSTIPENITPYYNLYDYAFELEKLKIK